MVENQLARRAKDGKKLPYPAWGGILTGSKQIIRMQKVFRCNIWIPVKAFYFFSLFFSEAKAAQIACLSACSPAKREVLKFNYIPTAHFIRAGSFSHSEVPEAFGLCRLANTCGKSDFWGKALGGSAWQGCTGSINGGRGCRTLCLLGSCCSQGYNCRSVTLLWLS